MSWLELGLAAVVAVIFVTVVVVAAGVLVRVDEKISKWGKEEG